MIVAKEMKDKKIADQLERNNSKSFKSVVWIS